MLKFVAPLLVLLVSGCSSLGSFNDGRFATPAEREAYIMGSAHAGLNYCAASLDEQALSMHEAVARRAALGLRGRPRQLEAAFEAGLREGGGFSSPHRVPCSEAAQVLNCSLTDYLNQWRASSEPSAKR